MKISHENRVEKFYSHGSDERGSQDGGFLSFGFWTKPSDTYHQAVEALISQILRFEEPFHSGMVLNVACGYGAETVKIYEKIRPDKIFAIDITGPHIEFAKETVKALNLSEQIDFKKMDACKLEFDANTFDYIIGIEGPAHFNTREVFLRKAFEVLKPGGVFLLSDIIVNRQITENNPYNRFIGNLCSKHWHMPKDNWMSIDELRVLLQSIGFRVDVAESIGDKVYPGFARFNLKWESIKNAFRIRGWRIGLGLTFISWLLGHTFKRQMIDYVFVRAVKV